MFSNRKPQKKIVTSTRISLSHTITIYRNHHKRISIKKKYKEKSRLARFRQSALKKITHPTTPRLRNSPTTPLNFKTHKKKTHRRIMRNLQRRYIIGGVSQLHNRRNDSCRQNAISTHSILFDNAHYVTNIAHCKCPSRVTIFSEIAPNIAILSQVFAESDTIVLFRISAFYDRFSSFK